MIDKIPNFLYPCKKCGKKRSYTRISNIRDVCVACTKKSSTTHPDMLWIYDRYKWVSIKKGKQSRLYTNFTCPICKNSRMVARYDVITWFKRRGKIDKRCNTCIVKSNRGVKHYNWKGGYISRRGYRVISIPYSDPYAKTGYKKKHSNSVEIAEHRYKMAKKIGRNLERHEEVHHINGNKIDNRLQNLLFISKTDHMRYHMEKRWKEKRSIT